MIIVPNPIDNGICDKCIELCRDVVGERRTKAIRDNKELTVEEIDKHRSDSDG